jgi:hypothetical protein
MRNHPTLGIFAVLMLVCSLASAQRNPVACTQCRDNCVDIHRIKCKDSACTAVGGRSRPSACDGVDTQERHRRYVEGLRACEAREKRCQDTCFAGPCGN